MPPSTCALSDSGPCTPTRLGLEEELRDRGMLEQQDPLPSLSSSLSQVLSHVLGALLEAFPFFLSKLCLGTWCGTLRLCSCWARRNRVDCRARGGAVGHQTGIWRTGSSVERKAFRMETQATSLVCPLERKQDPTGGSGGLPGGRGNTSLHQVPHAVLSA